MTELKTLKELGGHTFTKNGMVSGELAVDIKQLRAEAIKWILDLRENQDNPSFLCDKPEQMVCWIMYFFNITETDIELVDVPLANIPDDKILEIRKYLEKMMK